MPPVIALHCFLQAEKAPAAKKKRMTNSGSLSQQCMLLALAFCHLTGVCHATACDCSASLPQAEKAPAAKKKRMTKAEKEAAAAAAEKEDEGSDKEEEEAEEVRHCAEWAGEVWSLKPGVWVMLPCDECDVAMTTQQQCRCASLQIGIISVAMCSAEWIT
jgi:hypothetical protein